MKLHVVGIRRGFVSMVEVCLTIRGLGTLRLGESIEQPFRFRFCVVISIAREPCPRRQPSTYVDLPTSAEACRAEEELEQAQERHA